MDTLVDTQSAVVDILKIACGFFVGFLALDGFKAFVRYAKNRVRLAKQMRRATRARNTTSPVEEVEPAGYARL